MISNIQIRMWKEIWFAVPAGDPLPRPLPPGGAPSRAASPGGPSLPVTPFSALQD